jgi:hypothetical protein
LRELLNPDGAWKVDSKRRQPENTVVKRQLTHSAVDIAGIETTERPKVENDHSLDEAMLSSIQEPLFDLKGCAL